MHEHGFCSANFLFLMNKTSVCSGVVLYMKIVLCITNRVLVNESKFVSHPPESSFFLVTGVVQVKKRVNHSLVGYTVQCRRQSRF